MRNVLIISCSKYPNGNAGAVREHMFAKMYAENGDYALVVGMGPSTNFEIKKYDGIDYISLRKSPDNNINKALNRFLFTNRLKRFLKNTDTCYTDFLFVNSYLNIDILWIKKYAKEHNIRLYHDSVEFYSKAEYGIWWLSYEYMKNYLMNTRLIDSTFKVIAISQFLTNYFSDKEIKTITIPVLLDSNAIVSAKKDKGNEKIIITYAGNPGRKDRIDLVVKAVLSMHNNEKERVEIKIIGITMDKFCKLSGIPEEILRNNSNCVKFYGRIPRSDVIDALKETDFTVLMRDPSLRYAKAGFPTKVVESLMTGTPVLCNLSSDLEMYLTDHYNAIIVDDFSVDGVKRALEKVLLLSNDEINEMKKNARKSAVNHFDYHRYIELLTCF